MKAADDDPIYVIADGVEPEPPPPGFDSWEAKLESYPEGTDFSRPAHLPRTPIDWPRSWEEFSAQVAAIPPERRAEFAARREAEAAAHAADIAKAQAEYEQHRRDNPEHYARIRAHKVRQLARMAADPERWSRVDDRYRRRFERNQDLAMAFLRYWDAIDTANEESEVDNTDNNESVREPNPDSPWRRARARRAAEEAAAAATEPEIEDVPELPPLDGDPLDPDVAGGLLGEVTKWTERTMLTPVPLYSMLAAIAFMAAFTGRRYLSPTNMGTNLYLIGLGDSSTGKEAPQKAVRQLVEEVLGRRVISNKLTSDAAIELALWRAPNTLLVRDELGYMLQAVNDARAAPHTATVREMLLNIYSKSDKGNMHIGRRTADTETVRMDIMMPAFSLLGFSTQEQFYKGLPEESWRDGFAGRLLVFELPSTNFSRAMDYAVSEEMLARISDGLTADIPPDLGQLLTDARDAFPAAVAGNFADFNAIDPAQMPPVHRVPWADDAAGSAWLWVRGLELRNISHPNHDDIVRGICRRQAANTLKLATLRAVSRSPAAPTVTAEDVKWGWALVKQATANLEAGARRYMVGSKYEALCKDIVSALAKAKDQTLSRAQLGERKGISKVPPREREAALADLVARGTLATSGKTYRLLRRLDL